MTCENPFLCGEYIDFLGYRLEGTGWFLLMLVVAFALQVAANFVWVRSSQVTRELMRLKKENRKNLIFPSLLWTGISTFIYICRVVLIGGNNLYIYLIILVGNVSGTYWAQRQQEADKNNISSELLGMINMLTNSECKKGVKVDIDNALIALEKELSKRRVKKYRDKNNEYFNF